MQPSTRAQTDWLLVRPACLCFFISTGRLGRLEIMQPLHGLHGCLQLDGFFGLFSSNVGVLLCTTVFTNILIAVIDWRWRQICLQSCFFFSHSKWLRTASVYELSAHILFQLQLILAFFVSLQISPLLLFYIFLSSQLSFISCCWWIDWIELVCIWVFGGAFKALESWENGPTVFDSMSMSAQRISERREPHYYKFS